jgi:paired amphipathic helix protein Sin3a
MGQFNVKDTNKETKKRRGGPLNVNTLGAPVAGPSAEVSRMGDLQSNRAGSVQAQGMAKVSLTKIFASSTY